MPFDFLEVIFFVKLLVTIFVLLRGTNTLLKVAFPSKIRYAMLRLMS